MAAAIPPLPDSPNFGLLARCDGALLTLAGRAEQYFSTDPVTALIRLRQFGELLVRQLAARTGIYGDVEEPQAALLGRLQREGSIPRGVLDLLHDLRRAGNEAVHGNRGDYAAAMLGLKLAPQRAVFFHRTFGDRAFKPSPFQLPRPPADVTAELRAEIERLGAERDAGLSAAERARAATAAELASLQAAAVAAPAANAAVSEAASAAAEGISAGRGDDAGAD